MITYKTSDLFRRAKQLADLEGSNFIGWNESINSINEAYIGLYEKLISCGDNSYVKSFRMATGSEKLPEDFWQLKGVYLWNNGNLETINRRADNSGIHHLSYELRNGEINLFGNPNDVLVEYYPKPMTLTYKPNDVNIGLESGTYLDCHKHCFVYEDTDTDSNETLSIIDLDGYKTTKDFIQIEHDSVKKVILTEDYCAIDRTDNYLTIYQLSTGFSANVAGGISGFTTVVTESGKLLLSKYNSLTSKQIIYDFKLNSSSLDYYQVKELSQFAYCKYFVCDDELTDLFALNPMNKLTATKTIYNPDDIGTPDKLIYSDKKCYFLDTTVFGVLELQDDELYFGRIIDNAPGVPVGFIGIDERTGFGYCVKRFNNYIVRPYCEDTELNFPNSFYYQILSYILAINMKAKQGADTSLLSSQLAMAEQNFEETLGSDAFQFPRMGNVYH